MTSAHTLADQVLAKPANAREPQIFIGVDLGQVRDPTAISILDRTDFILDRNRVNFAWNVDTRYAVRYLERVPLGTHTPT